MENPRTGKDLLEIRAKSVTEFARKVGEELFTAAEIQKYMLSPTKGSRPDFPADRKQNMKGSIFLIVFSRFIFGLVICSYLDAIMKKYGDNATLAWANAKYSFNKRGPELTYELKRNSSKPTPGSSEGSQ